MVVLQTTQLSKEMVAYNSLDEKEQSLTISPENSTVTKVNVEDAASVAAAALDEKYIYAVTFSDTATSKHGDLVVYLDENGQQEIGKSFQTK